MKNNIIQKFKIRYNNTSLYNKLRFTYSSSTLFVFFLLLIIAFPVIIRIYYKQIHSIQDQNYNQTATILTQHIDNLYYMSRIMETDAELQVKFENIVNSTDNSIPEQYRHYWTLNELLQNKVVNTNIYRTAIYIPDDYVYSSNNYYFFSQSQLTEIPDYQRVLDNVLNNRKTFVVMREIHTHQPITTREDYLALFGTLKNTNKIISKVEIPLSTVIDTLKSAVSYKGQKVILFDNTNQIIASSDGKTLDNNIIDSLSLNPGQKDRWLKIKIGHKSYYQIYRRVSEWELGMYAIFPMYEFLKPAFIGIASIIVIYILLYFMITLISKRIAAYYVKRLTQLSGHMAETGQGNFNTVEIEKHSSDEIDEIYRRFNTMQNQLEILMKENYEQGKSMVSSELKALQAQINPHFLYNTLDLINWEAMKYKASNISLIAQNLGRFFRLSLNHGKTAITIRDELKLVESYVAIENFHFDGAITLEIIVPEELRNYACLGIIFQPFVENAIIHGIADNKDIKECTVVIYAEQDNNDILFYIKDNGPGIDEEKLKEVLSSLNSPQSEGGYGIRNIDSRFKLCYGQDYGVQITSTSGKGTSVLLKIPVMSLEELEEKLK